MVDYEEPEAITVKELMKLLRKMPQDSRVYLEGCDCVGQAVGVDDDGNGKVVIERF